MSISRILEQLQNLAVQILNSKTPRKLSRSLGPYCLAAAILPGGIVLVPLFLLFPGRKAALEEAMIRTVATVRSNVLKTVQLLVP